MKYWFQGVEEMQGPNSAERVKESFRRRKFSAKSHGPENKKWRYARKRLTAPLPPKALAHRVYPFLQCKYSYMTNFKLPMRSH